MSNYFSADFLYSLLLHPLADSQDHEGNKMASNGSSSKVPLHLQSAHNRVLIQGGTVVNADGSQRADVYVEDA